MKNCLCAFFVVLSAGCTVTHTYRSEGPDGTTFASRESSAGGLVVREDVVTQNNPSYNACLEARRSQAAGYTDDQASCFSQTTGGTPIVPVPYSPYGYGNYRQQYGYPDYNNWTGAPRW